MQRIERITYGGVTWRRYPDSPDRSIREYFRRAPDGKRDGYLHRQIWIDQVGAIPDGWHIHHKDGNCQNNSLDNLECLPPAEHFAKHEVWGGRRDEFIAHLERIRPLTKAWHRSPEGIAKHREIGALAYRNFQGKPKRCLHCGKEFITRKTGHQDRYCSNACKSAYRRVSGVDNETRQCACCGQDFTINKYSKARCCSRHCAIRLRYGKEQQGVRPDGG